MNASIIRKIIRNADNTLSSDSQESQPEPISQNHDTVGQYTIVFERSTNSHNHNQETVKK
jgi:hypothetical protein